MARIERVQYQAALAITGCWKGSNQNALYEELGWETLSDRRWFRRLTYLYKIKNNMAPDYLTTNLPQFQGRSLRNNQLSNFKEILCSTSRYQNSFFPDAIKLWNNIGVDFNSTQSLELFKANIIKLIRPPSKPLYGIHDPLDVKLLFRLRFHLSDLRYHKWRHNFTDVLDDMCFCLSASENTSHFLFHCRLHDIPRVKLRNSVVQILIQNNLEQLHEDVNTYIYGNASLSFSDNKLILLSTINFIKETGRFT